MDYGKLTDHNGKKIDFTNVMLIMTSNAGATNLEKQAIGFSREINSDDGEVEINRIFTPEFRNRLDAIINFSFLSEATMSMIVDKSINLLEAQLTEKNITISLTDKARSYLAQKGYDKTYGARPLHRLIQKEIKEPLSEEILFGKLINYGEVLVDLKDNKIDIRFIKKKSSSKNSVIKI